MGVKAPLLTFPRSFFSSQLLKLSFSNTAAGPAFLLYPFQVRFYASKRKMPPKKEVKQEKILLGRPGNNLKSGIVCTTCACSAARPLLVGIVDD